MSRQPYSRAGLTISVAAAGDRHIPAGADGAEMLIECVEDIDEPVTITVDGFPNVYVFTERGQSIRLKMEGGGWAPMAIARAGHVRGRN